MSILLLNGPSWFWGIDVIFALVFTLVTLLITLMSNKAYKITEDPKYKFFSLSFLLISLASLVFAVFNSILIFHLSDKVNLILSAFDFAFLIQVFLSLLAYMILIIIVFKIKDTKVVTLLLSLLLLFIIFSHQYTLKYHLTSLVLLAFLAYQFYLNFQEKKSKNTRLVFTSFYLLACAEIFYIINIFTTEYLYVVGQLVQLLGFLVLFYMFMRVLHYGGEKRKA